MTLAANILDFAEITGGTGTEAVERLNSLVKTGVIAEADMGVTMDKLTIAHQRWGGSINEVMDALTKFAPAMNALGMSTDEAISWMTIFNKAGVDSQRVVMGFTRRWPRSSRPRSSNSSWRRSPRRRTTSSGPSWRSTCSGAAGSALAYCCDPAPRASRTDSIIWTDYTGRVTKAGRGQRQHVRRPGAAELHNFQGTLAGLAGSLGTSSDAI